MKKKLLAVFTIIFSFIEVNAQLNKNYSEVLNPYELIKPGLIEVIMYHTKSSLIDIVNELENKYDFQIDEKIDEEAISGGAMLAGYSKNESCLLVTIERIEEEYEEKIYKRDISIKYSWECD